MAQRTLFTIGHSTRSWAEFIALLKAWKIEEVVDVRTVPRSKMFPWFSKGSMGKSLPKSAIRYFHLPQLGGLRRPSNASTNTGWQNDRFRAYADYMQSKEFEQGLNKLNRSRKQRRVCVMCSEAVWWRCHRRMIADAEVARGIPVKHVMSEKVARLHVLTEFAMVQKKAGRIPVISYPGAEKSKGVSK